MLTLDDVKNYLRIDLSDEDTLLTTLLNSSQSFVKNATHPNADPTTDLFKSAQLLLIAHWYMNRGITGYRMTELPMSVDIIFSQIMFTTEDTV